MTIEPPRIEFHARREAEGLWIVSCAALGIDFSANSLQEAYARSRKRSRSGGA